MKKLLALILALLLPGAALGEAWCFDAALSVDADYAAELLAPQMAETYEEAASDAEAIVKAIVGLLDGLSLHVVSQEDAASVDLRVGGKAFVDFAVRVNSEQMVITSDMMPGYVLTQPMDPSDEAAVADAPDWQQIVTDALASAAECMDEHVEASVSYGAFAGDAYKGGACCHTYVLDDSAVAAILGSMMTTELREAATSFLTAADMDADGILAELDALHEKVAEENAHTYIIRMVSDAAVQPVGMSVTVLREAAQVATLSVGYGSGALRFVLGTGDDVVNRWYDFQLRAESEASWSGWVVQFTGNKDESFAYAAAVMTEPDSALTWTLDIERMDSGFSWRYAHQTEGRSYTLPESVVSTGEYAAGTFQSETMLSVDDRELAQLTLSVERGEGLPALAEGLTFCDLSSMDEEQLILQDEAAALIAQVLSMRVMQLIPMDLLLLLQ